VLHAKVRSVEPRNLHSHTSESMDLINNLSHVGSFVQVVRHELVDRSDVQSGTSGEIGGDVLHLFEGSLHRVDALHRAGLDGIDEPGGGSLREGEREKERERDMEGGRKRDGERKRRDELVTFHIHISDPCPPPSTHTLTCRDEHRS